MTCAQVRLSMPPASFFSLPPDPNPATIPPPNARSFKSPFYIDPNSYRQALDARIPITVAACYYTFVTICNRINRRRGNKAWPISTTRAFYLFTLFHNLLLAIYSAVTCAALVRAVYASWAGFTTQSGLPGMLDSLCKIHGPRGYGDAVTYDASVLKWTVRNQVIHLGQDGLTPDDTDVGRIWNEGLAFWGWLFYLSKYYEVVDTFIILLKGKRCTLLQKYHHTGAMLCVWAGIRYMSPPIWMFVLVNSGIHAFMYTYYTASTLGIYVPKSIKQTITTMQITQFVVGASYAAAHLFISYSVPVSTSYSVVSVVSAAASAAKTAPSLASELPSKLVNNTHQGYFPPWFKRLAYRAAGAEGLAENVHDDILPDSHRLAVSAKDAIGRNPRSTVRHMTSYEMIGCLDTHGEAFAIWINVIYLIPLTLMFATFFSRSYFKNTGAQQKKTESAGNKTAESKTPSAPEKARRVSDAARDAVERTSETMEELDEKIEESMDPLSEEVEANSQQIRNTKFSSRSETAGQWLKGTLGSSNKKSSTTTSHTSNTFESSSNNARSTREENIQAAAERKSDERRGLDTPEGTSTTESRREYADESEKVKEDNLKEGTGEEARKETTNDIETGTHENNDEAVMEKRNEEEQSDQQVGRSSGSERGEQEQLNQREDGGDTKDYEEIGNDSEVAGDEEQRSSSERQDEIEQGEGANPNKNNEDIRQEQNQQDDQLDQDQQAQQNQQNKSNVKESKEETQNSEEDNTSNSNTTHEETNSSPIQGSWTEVEPQKNTQETEDEWLEDKENRRSMDEEYSMEFKGRVSNENKEQLEAGETDGYEQGGSEEAEQAQGEDGSWGFGLNG